MNEPFTHIVVGGGTAGSIVASRISEIPLFRVLLIEAGPDYHPRNSSNARLRASIEDARRVPMKGQTDSYIADIDWNVEVRMTNSATVTVPQAKVLGGGSSINGGTALRSTRADSDEWVALGNSAWAFEEVLPMYQALESTQVDLSRADSAARHPLACATIGELGQIQHSFIQGATHYGLDFIEDMNTTGCEGVGYSPVCRVGHKRVSLANTFIDGIRSRDNLIVMTDRTVNRLLFTRGKAQANGIELADGTQFHATAEVILCAGAIFSPAILQRSGIGPRGDLIALGISPMVDLPVGAHLSDHPCIPIMTRPRVGAYKTGDYSLQCNARWSSQLGPNAIDLQLVCFSYLYTQPDPSKRFQRSLAGESPGHVAGIGCNVNKPRSLGSVMIKSSDAYIHPTIEPNYLQSTVDRALAREVVRKGFQVITSPEMQKTLEPPIDIDHDIISTDEKLDQYISDHLTSTYHFCGSCRMANRVDGGVVDSSGRVYGVNGLRVVDASIIPTIPACNTMWPTAMFAERIGSSIRDGHEVGSEFHQAQS